MSTKVFEIRATVIIRDADKPVELVEAPPSRVEVRVDEPLTIPFGKVRDPEGAIVAVSLTPPIAGCSLSWSPEDGQVTFIWSGTGTPGVYATDLATSAAPPADPSAPTGGVQ